MKQQILSLLRSTQRPGIENLIKYMEESDFFTAPCSTQYHLCKEGGLAEHSLNVYKRMADSWFTTDKTIDTNSIRITALLHDIGKATYRGKPNYTANILKSGKVSDNKPYETNKDRLYIPHEIVSLQIISKFIDLTEEEEYAILWHNALYVPMGRELNGKERPLQLLLHFSDLWVSRFEEVD